MRAVWRQRHNEYVYTYIYLHTQLKKKSNITHAYIHIPSMLELLIKKRDGFRSYLVSIIT